jgi:hypothetical protein
MIINCSEHPNAKVVPSKEYSVAESGLTEERKAAIIKEYGLPEQKPKKVSGCFSYDFGFSYAETNN